MSRKLLVVVDMQKDFIDGALGSKEAILIVDNCEAKIRSAMQNGDMVIFTRDTHGVDYMQTEEGANLPVPHCIKDSEGWMICSKLRELSDISRIFDKVTFGSVLLGEEAKKLCEEENLSSIELIGLCTDICVISNALLLKAFCPDVPVYVDASCCAGVSPQSHDTALAAMETCHIHVTGKGNEPWRQA